MQVVAIADDLSGATETLAALGIWGSKVWLNTESPKSLLNEMDSGNHLVIDTNSRSLSATDARLNAKKISNLVSNLKTDALMFRKVDSLLRGNVAAEVEEAHTNGPVVIALANPETQRATLDGVVLIQGVPLHLTDLWQAEATEPWASIGEALGKTKNAIVPLLKVREGLENLASTLQELASSNTVAICDSETDADLTSIVLASAKVMGAQLIGTAGLARAIGKILKPAAIKINLPTPDQKGLMVIVGSGAEASRRQVEALEGKGIKVHALTTSGLDRENSQAATTASLVLTGGETARAVLAATSTDWIRPFEEIENGVVASETNNHQIVITKPGSYGDDLTLVRAVNYIKALSTNELSKK